MIFLDANVIAKAFFRNKDKEKCQKTLHLNWMTDTLCLIEAHHTISKITKNKVYATQCIKSLYKTSGIIISLDKNLLFGSFSRIYKYNLNSFDIIHYVAALLNNCSEIVSYDKDFDNLEIKRIEP